MHREFSGKRMAAELRVGIVVSRFNDMVTKRLLEGALDALARHTSGEGGSADVFWVPGSFELPMTARRVVNTKQYEAVVALGCLVRGQTDHYELLAHEVTKGLAQIAIKSVIPVTFGVVTADTVEQALERAGLKQGNKGFDAMVSAIEVVSLYRQIAEVEAEQ
ncbi:MAG: 6,7-dimethyl-8-ribityllumazine synthase [bacterium]